VREYSDTGRYMDLKIRVFERLSDPGPDNYREPLGTMFFEFPLIINSPEEDLQEGINWYTEQARNPFWTSYNRRKLVDILLSKVFNSEMPVYRYGTNVRTSREEVERAFNAGWMQMVYQDDRGEMQDTSVYIDYSIEEVQSVVFIEEWEIDPISHTIYKKVLGIAPVRHFINPESEEWDKRILFTVYFDPEFEERVRRMYQQ
jgi:hypothetical protein